MLDGPLKPAKIVRRCCPGITDCGDVTRGQEDVTGLVCSRRNRVNPTKPKPHHMTPSPTFEIVLACYIIHVKLCNIYIYIYVCILLYIH